MNNRLRSLLVILLFLIIPFAIFAQDPTAVPPLPGPNTPVGGTPIVLPVWTQLFVAFVAFLVALVGLARVIVKLTPTPDDDTKLEKFVTFLKHLGLHIGCIVFALALLAGCQGYRPPTTAAANYDQDSQTASGSVTSQLSSNITAGVQGTYNVATHDYTVGVVITFKNEPSDYAKQALAAAGAIPYADITNRGLPAFILQIPKSKARDTKSKEFNAVLWAITEGATIAPINQNP